jgi:hypothetical protein
MKVIKYYQKYTQTTYKYISDIPKMHLVVNIDENQKIKGRNERRLGILSEKGDYSECPVPNCKAIQFI